MSDGDHWGGRFDETVKTAEFIARKVVGRPCNNGNFARASAIIANYMNAEIQKAFMEGQNDCLKKMAVPIKDAAYIVTMNELASRYYCASDCNEIATRIGSEMMAWAEGQGEE